jgi:hypothetical protein
MAMGIVIADRLFQYISPPNAICFDQAGCVAALVCHYIDRTTIWVRTDNLGDIRCGDTIAPHRDLLGC